jgi:hypothetical protein
MKLRITILGSLLLLAAILGSTSNRNQTSAAEFSCKSSQCPNSAKCEGDHWARSECAITCYRDAGAPGEIVVSGSANCGTGDGGRAIGDGPPSN